MNNLFELLGIRKFGMAITNMNVIPLAIALIINRIIILIMAIKMTIITICTTIPIKRTTMAPIS